MEDDDNIEASNEFCSSSQPYISWVPSPPSKKIKKYIYQLPPLVRNHALHVSESVTPMEILKHQDPKDLFSDDYDVNVNLGENQTHNDNQHENENEDYFDNLILSSESLFFNSELQEFVEDGSKYITEDDNELFFACATQIETISSLEEAIGKFTAIQISIKEIFAHDSGLIVSVLSIKGINSVLTQQICIRDISIYVSISWETLERCIPCVEKGDIRAFLIDRIFFQVFVFAEEKMGCRPIYFGGRIF